MFILFYLQPQEEFRRAIPLTPQKPKRISFKDEMDKSLSKNYINQRVPTPEVHKNRATASEYTPKVHIIADYIMWVNIQTKHVKGL